jgi:hypothetical protein
MLVSSAACPGGCVQRADGTHCNVDVLLVTQAPEWDVPDVCGQLLQMLDRYR